MMASCLALHWFRACVRVHSTGTGTGVQGAPARFYVSLHGVPTGLNLSCQVGPPHSFSSRDGTS